MALRRSWMSTVCTMPSYPFFALILLLVLPRAVAADGDSPDELAFTVFTDLAPLLALFGEQFARQFMSESLTWLDHIVFAMAPLGILTAIIGAIRVSGPGWARAFIGRARESRAAAEIELMSSTSREVCEVYNGRGVVRAMGKPKITQFILFPPDYRDDDETCGIYTLEEACKCDEPVLEIGKYGIKTDWNPPKQEPGTRAKNAAAANNNDSSTNKPATLRSPNPKPSARHGPRPTGIWNRDKRARNDLEKGSPIEVHANHENELHEDELNEAQNGGQIPIPHELKGAAPNLQLNLPCSMASHKSTIKDLWIAALVAVPVQISVVIVSVITSFHAPTQDAVGRPPTNYGFWLFLAGTLCLGSGMILCSFVIEQSTREWAWRKAPHKGAHSPGLLERKANRESALVTPMPQTVGDITINGTKEPPQTTSQDTAIDKVTNQTGTCRARETLGKDGHLGIDEYCDCLQLFWLQRKHTVNDQAFDPFLIFGGHKIEFLTSSRSDLKRHEFLTVFASALGLVGFILQFEGLRGLAWPTAVAQLVAILIMALVRAIVRRRLGEGPIAVTSQDDHELDWLGLRLVYEGEALTAPSKPQDTDTVEMVTQWRVLTRPDLVHQSLNNEQQRPSNQSEVQVDDRTLPRLLMETGRLDPAGQEPGGPLRQRVGIKPREKQNELFEPTSQNAVSVRRRLGELACPGVASREAIALAQAMSLVLADFCAIPIDEEKHQTFTWSLGATMKKANKKAKISYPIGSLNNRSGWLASSDSDSDSSAFSTQGKSNNSKHATHTDFEEDVVKLQAQGTRTGWTVQPSDIDAILSLWISTLVQPSNVTDPKTKTLGKDGSVNQDGNDVMSSSWLSQIAGNTIKYRRILGENPLDYEQYSSAETILETLDDEDETSTFRTDILTRDLNWWTSDPRITAINDDTHDPLDTGDITLEIGYNGLQPDIQEPSSTGGEDSLEEYKSKPTGAPSSPGVAEEEGEKMYGKVVGIISSGPLATVLTHHLFSAFMWAVSKFIGADKLDSATVEDAELFDGSDFHNTWHGPTLRNKRLMKLARAIVGFGLGPIDDVLLGIIPPLSYRRRLPNEAMMSVLLMKAKEHEKYHDWDQAQKAYRHLIELPLQPRQMDRISYEVVVEIIEFLFLARETVDDLEGLVSSRSIVASDQGDSLRKAEKAVTKSLNANFLLDEVVKKLEWFYHKQRRDRKYARLLQTLESAENGTEVPSPPLESDSKNEVGKIPVPTKELKQLTKFRSNKTLFKDRNLTKSSAQYDEIRRSDIFGWYPLHYAAVGKKDSMFETVLKRCNRREISQHVLKDRSGRTPLHYAAMYRPHRVRVLISNDQKGRSAATARGRDGTFPIHCAARYGMFDSVEVLYKYSSPTAVDAFNRSALHLGVMKGHWKIVDHFAKDENITIMQTGEELLGRTALHLALLSNAGRKGNEGEGHAIRGLMQKIVERLMVREKDLSVMTIVDEAQASPITLALENRDDAFFKLMLAKLSKVQRVQDPDSEQSPSTVCFKTALEEAVRKKGFFALDILFGHVRDHKWETAWIIDAFDAARQHKYMDVTHKMLEIVSFMVSNSISDSTIAPPEMKSQTSPDDIIGKPATSQVPSMRNSIHAAETHKSEPSELPSTFSAELLRGLRAEYGSNASTNLSWAIREGVFPFAELMLEADEEIDIVKDYSWNQKHENRSGLCYIAKAKPSSKLSDISTDSDTRVQVLRSLWRSWDSKAKIRALHERQGRYKKTPLMYAAKNGLLSLLQYFLQHDAQVRVRGSYGNRTALFYAIQRNDSLSAETCKLLIEKDWTALEDRYESWGTTPLIHAIRYQNSHVIDLLSAWVPSASDDKIHIDPNIPDNDGDSTLAWCYWSWAPMIKTLYRKFPKIDPHQRNKEGASPRMIAYRDAIYGKLAPSIRDMFSGPNEGMRKYEGNLMLSHAIRRTNAKVVKFLLDAGADPRSTDDAKRTQIELAAICGSLEVFRLLCTKGITQHELKRIGHACIQLLDSSSEQVWEELKKMKITLKKTDLDANGWSMEECAAYSGNLEAKGKWLQLLSAATDLPLSSATPGKSMPRHMAPNSWSVSGDNPFLEVRGPLLEIVYPFPERLRSSSHTGTQILIRADYCIPARQKKYYWELEVLRHFGKECISMGICCHNSDFHCHPGWTNSWGVGYHGDDGGLFTDGRASRSTGPKWGQGDVVGCLVELIGTQPSVQFFFRKEKIGQALPLPRDMRGQLYPCVGLDAGPRTMGTTIKATFGATLPQDVDQSSITKKDEGTQSSNRPRKEAANLESDAFQQESIVTAFVGPGELHTEQNAEELLKGVAGLIDGSEPDETAENDTLGFSLFD